MYKIQIETSQNVNLFYNTASLGERLIARIIDLIVITIYQATVFYIFDEANFDSYALSRALTYVFSSISFFYPLIFEYFFEGQTIGKKALNIQVVMQDGSMPTLGSYTIRWLLGLIESVLFLGAPAVISILISRKGQRIGDIAANTSVIKKEKRKWKERTVRNFPANYEVMFPPVKYLNDRQIEMIEDVLHRKDFELRNRQIYALTIKVKEFLDMDSNLKPTEFLNRVVSDYEFIYWVDENKGQIEELRFQDRRQKAYGTFA